MTRAVQQNLKKALALLPQTQGIPINPAFAIPVEDFMLKSDWAEVRPDLARRTTFEAWRGKRQAIVDALHAAGLKTETISIRAHHFRAWLAFHQLPHTRESLVHYLRDGRRGDRRIMKHYG